MESDWIRSLCSYSCWTPENRVQKIKQYIWTSFTHLRSLPKQLLKELQKFILCIICAWALFLYNTDLYDSALPTYFFEQLVFLHSVFRVFILFCFEIDVMVIDFLKYLHNFCLYRHHELFKGAQIQIWDHFWLLQVL